MEDSLMTGTIHPERVLQELERLWNDLGRNQGDEPGEVARACSMTLIVLTDPATEQEPAIATLAELMREHPARAIIVRVDPGGTSSVEAGVSAQCWRPFGKRQQVCCEQIEISVSPDSLPDAFTVLPALIASDVPVVLWFRSGELINAAPCEAILPFAAKVLVDSSELGAPADALEQLERLSASVNVGDLNWTRVTRWRETIAQLFEMPEYVDRARLISHVTIRHRTPEAPAAAFYLAAWVRHSLPNQVAIEFQHAEGTSQGKTQSVVLSGGDFSIELRRTGAHCVEVTAGSITSSTTFPSFSEWQLVSKELALLERDPIHRDVLKLAALMAREGVR